MMPRRVIWSALGVAMAVFMVNFASLAGADSGIKSRQVV